MNHCEVCHRETKLERRVNAIGVVFCSDDCYEEYSDTLGHPTGDFEHPYIDDYELIRIEFIKWQQQFEDLMYAEWLYGAPSKKSLLEDLDEFLWEFSDYIAIEGQDGIFSAEIYHYILKFEQLIKVIEAWEPDGEELAKRRQALCEAKKHDE